MLKWYVNISNISQDYCNISQNNFDRSEGAHMDSVSNDLLIKNTCMNEKHIYGANSFIQKFSYVPYMIEEYEMNISLPFYYHYPNK